MSLLVKDYLTKPGIKKIKSLRPAFALRHGELKYGILEI
jgi:hypothetical protein